MFKRLFRYSQQSNRKMCILFVYNGAKVESSDYSLILVSNRDEYYKRLTKNLAPWDEDRHIFGGRDLEAGSYGGTWLAISTIRKKIGVLLNLPRTPKDDAISRGKIVEDFVKNSLSIQDYTEKLRTYVDKSNGFVFIAVEFSNLSPSIHTYSNETDKLLHHDELALGFGNSLPNVPLKKVEAGKTLLENICTRHGSVASRYKLVGELMQLLKSNERYLPDPELESRRPEASEQLSSIFVTIPQVGYGTRTHTIILITKEGKVDVIEETLQSPIDINNPHWHRTELQLQIVDCKKKLSYGFSMEGFCFL